MTDNDIPVWALDKAAAVTEWGDWAEVIGDLGDDHSIVRSVRAHAALIAKHEQPPVDPDLIEARECAALHYEGQDRKGLANNIRAGMFDDNVGVAATLIRLQREKEGKRA